MKINQVLFIFNTRVLSVKKTQASTLVGLTPEKPELDPLPVQHLHNPLYMFKKYLNKIKITFLCQILSTILISLNSKTKVKKTPSW